VPARFIFQKTLKRRSLRLHAKKKESLKKDIIGAVTAAPGEWCSGVQWISAFMRTARADQMARLAFLRLALKTSHNPLPHTKFHLIQSEWEVLPIAGPQVGQPVSVAPG
jgi:hypothetical protein